MLSGIRWGLAEAYLGRTIGAARGGTIGAARGGTIGARGRNSCARDCAFSFSTSIKAVAALGLRFSSCTPWTRIWANCARIFISPPQCSRPACPASEVSMIFRLISSTSARSSTSWFLSEPSHKAAGSALAEVSLHVVERPVSGVGLPKW